MNHLEWWTGDNVLYHGIPAVVTAISYNQAGCMIEIEDDKGERYCVGDTSIKRMAIE